MMNLGLGFLGIFDVVKSGISPGPGDPKAWYDRAIRIVGGSILILLITGAVIVGWVNVFQAQK